MAEVKIGYLSADTLTNIANAIRKKNGSTNVYKPSEMAAAIEGISAGIDTSDATATAADILSGQTAYVNGEKITGSLETVTVYSGTTIPDSSLGNVGDIYLLITVEDVVTYAINSTLIGCTLSNTASSVEENTSYTATVAAKSNYTISTVVVTMGSSNVTDTVYDSTTGLISISSVTGDVVIVARATEDAIVIDDEIGSVSSDDNSISLNSSVASGEYTLYYEDADNNKLSEHEAIGTITQ